MLAAVFFTMLTDVAMFGGAQHVDRRSAEIRRLLASSTEVQHMGTSVTSCMLQNPDHIPAWSCAPSWVCVPTPSSLGTCVSTTSACAGPPCDRVVPNCTLGTICVGTSSTDAYCTDRDCLEGQTATNTDHCVLGSLSPDQCTSGSSCMEIFPTGICVREECTAVTGALCEPSATRETLPNMCCSSEQDICTNNPPSYSSTCQRKMCTQGWHQPCNEASNKDNDPTHCCGGPNLECRSGLCQHTSTNRSACSVEYQQPCKPEPTGSSECCNTTLYGKFPQCLYAGNVSTGNATVRQYKCLSPVCTSQPCTAGSTQPCTDTCVSGATAETDPTNCCKAGVCINSKCTEPVCQVAKNGTCDPAANSTSNPSSCCTANLLCIDNGSGATCQHQYCTAARGEHCSVTATAAKPTLAAECCSKASLSCMPSMPSMPSLSSTCEVRTCTAQHHQPCAVGATAFSSNGRRSACCAPGAGQCVACNNCIWNGTVPNDYNGICINKYVPPTNKPTNQPTPPTYAPTYAPTTSSSGSDNKMGTWLGLVLGLVGLLIGLLIGLCWRHAYIKKKQAALDSEFRETLLAAPPRPPGRELEPELSSNNSSEIGVGESTPGASVELSNVRPPPRQNLARDVVRLTSHERLTSSSIPTIMPRPSSTAGYMEYEEHVAITTNPDLTAQARRTTSTNIPEAEEYVEYMS